MTLQTIEPVLYLPDDTAFYAEPGDDWLGLRLFVRAAGLILLSLLVYLPVLIWGGLVWQDDARVTQNVFLWSWSGLLGVWAHPIGGWYRPLAQSVLWGEHHFFHLHPLGYHLVSVVFHGVNGGLLWMVLRRLGVRGGWLAAALFVVHPIQVQSVAWLSQQSHLVGTGFFLGATWAFLRLGRIQPPLPQEFGPSPGHNWQDLMPVEPLKRLYGLAIGLALAACLSDPIGFALPLVLLILIWWKQGTVTRGDWLRLAPIFAVALAAAALSGWVIARGSSSDFAGAGPPLSIAQRLLVDARAIAWYADTILWPFPLLFAYDRWSPIVWGSSQVIFPIGVLLVLAAAWWARRWLGRSPLAAVMLFIALLLPGLGSVLGTSTPAIYVADHWAYLSVAVPAAIVASLLLDLVSWVSSDWIARGLRVAIAGACCGGLGFIAWQKGTMYDREESVWLDALGEQPRSSVAINAYARLLLKQRNDLEASKVLQRAGDIGTSDVALLQTRAQVYVAQRRFSEAAECYLAAHRLEPDNDQISIGLAEAYARDGRAAEAMQVYIDALRRHPSDAAMQNDVGLLLMYEGKIDDAIDRYQQALAANSRFLPARINLAHAYEARAARAKSLQAATPDLDRAAKELQRVVELDPRNYYAYYNAGAMLYRLRDFAHAEQMFRAAVTIQPNAADAWDKLGITEAAQGKERMNEAVWNFDHAVQLDPNLIEARQHLQKARGDIAASNDK